MPEQPAERKLRWTAARAAAGVREMGVASFVPPAAMPQTADELRVMVLAPNLRGAQTSVGMTALAICSPSLRGGS